MATYERAQKQVTKLVTAVMAKFHSELTDEGGDWDDRDPARRITRKEEK